MNYSDYRDNSKRVEDYATSMAEKASRWMTNVECGNRLFTSQPPNGDLNYLYIIKQPCGRVDQYTKFGHRDPKLPTEINVPKVTPKAPMPSPNNASQSINLTPPPFTQPNFDNGEDKKEDEEEEKTIMLASIGDEKSNEVKKELFNSSEEYENAVSRTRRDEETKYEKRWWSTGKCIHCGDANLCHVFKFGQFCINAANATRKGSDTEERRKLLNTFCDAYQYAAQYVRYIGESPGPHRQIQEADLENMPHCTYRLMDNWLKAVKQTSKAGGLPTKKRNNDDKNHDGGHKKKQRSMK